MRSSRFLLFVVAVAASAATMAKSAEVNSLTYYGTDPLGQRLYKQVSESLASAGSSREVSKLMSSRGDLHLGVSIHTRDPDGTAGDRTVASIAFRELSYEFEVREEDGAHVRVRTAPRDDSSLEWERSHFAVVCEANRIQACANEVLDVITMKLDGLID